MHYANPTPTTPTNFKIAQELQFQYADCTSKVHKKCPTVLYASSFFSHPHWPYITAYCLHSTPSSSNVTAGGSQYVICAKYKIHKPFNQQLQPRDYYTCHLLNIILTIISCPVPPRLVHGMLWHWLDLQKEWLCISYFYIPNVSGVDLRPRYPVYDQCVLRQSKGSPWVILLQLCRQYLRH